MTVTYSLDFDNTPSDVVRLCVGDTDVDNALLQDEEINYFISKHQSGATPTDKELDQACIDSAYAIIAKVESALEEEQTGQVRVRLRDRLKFLTSVIERLKKKVRLVSPTRPFLGGSSKSRMCTNRADEDRVQPEIGIDYFNNPDAEKANGEYDD